MARAALQIARLGTLRSHHSGEFIQQQKKKILRTQKRGFSGLSTWLVCLELCDVLFPIYRILSFYPCSLSEPKSQVKSSHKSHHLGVFQGPVKTMRTMIRPKLRTPLCIVSSGEAPLPVRRTLQHARTTEREKHPSPSWGELLNNSSRRRDSRRRRLVWSDSNQSFAIHLFQ